MFLQAVPVCMGRPNSVERCFSDCGVVKRLESVWLNFDSQPGYSPGTYPGHMLRSMRGPTGAPRLRIRVLAAAVVIGLVALSAPVVVLPAVRWLVDAATP